MREFLWNNATTLVWVIAAIHLVFLAAFSAGYARRKHPMLLCMALICLGLFLDAFIIALGAFPLGGALETVSKLRFFSHGALIPLLFPICGYALRAGKKSMALVWGFTAVVMVAGVAQAAVSVLERRELAGLIRYAASDATPAWAALVSDLLSFGTVIPLILCGAVVWAKQKTPHLFLAGLLMFVFAGLGPATGNMDLLVLLSMIGEVLMDLFFWLYSRRSPAAARVAAGKR